jgi:hypothetical protein
MSLLEPPAESSSKSRPMAFLLATLAIVAVIALWWTFRFYPEKRAAERFFEALVAGDMDKAYQIWKPSPSYKMQDFLADWGPNGYYGPIKSFRIIRASSPRGASGVVIEVAVSPYSPMPNAQDDEKSRKTRIVTVWVDSKDKSFSFPP